MASNTTGNWSATGWFLAFLAMVLAGCQTAKQTTVAEQPQVAPPAQVVLVAESGLSAEDRLRKVIRQLELGEVAVARVELEAYLAEKPDSKVARDLLRQIDVPSREYYPTESFNVRLTPGDSLSTLAQKYLGTYYQFYGLAKYNSIARPSDLKVGQIVSIPLTESARLARQNRAAAGELEEIPELLTMPQQESTQRASTQLASTTTLHNWATVKSLVAQNNFQGAVDAVEAMPKPPLGAVELALAVQAYSGNGEKLATANPKLASAQYLQAAKLHKTAGNSVAAYAAVQHSVQLDSSNVAASQLEQGLKSELAGEYHKQASMAFRRQALDEAIALWDKVLAIDPNHQYAISYRLQALELKNKLSNLQ